MKYLTALIATTLWLVTLSVPAVAQICGQTLNFNGGESELYANWSIIRQDSKGFLTNDRMEARIVDGDIAISSDANLASTNELIVKYKTNLLYAYWGVGNDVWLRIADEWIRVRVGSADYNYNGPNKLFARVNTTEAPTWQNPADIEIVPFTYGTHDVELKIRADGVQVNIRETDGDPNDPDVMNTFLDVEIPMDEIDSVEFGLNTTTNNNAWSDDLSFECQSAAKKTSFLGYLLLGDLKSNSTIMPSDIDYIEQYSSPYSHIILSFGKPDINPLESGIPKASNNNIVNFQENHNKKLLISLGGGGFSSFEIRETLFECVSDFRPFPIEFPFLDETGSCVTLANKIIEDALESGFSGVDIDFESFWDGIETEIEKQDLKLGYKLFIYALSDAIDTFTQPSDNFYLTVAIQGGSYGLQKYSLSEIEPYVDYFNLMGYDKDWVSSSGQGEYFIPLSGYGEVRLDIGLMLFDHGIPESKIVYLMPYYVRVPPSYNPEKKCGAKDEASNRACAFKDFIADDNEDIYTYDVWTDNFICPADIGWLLCNRLNVDELVQEGPVLEKLYQLTYNVGNSKKTKTAKIWVNDSDTLQCKVNQALLEYPNLGGFGVWHISNDTETKELGLPIKNLIDAYSEGIYEPISCVE